MHGFSRLVLGLALTMVTSFGLLDGTALAWSPEPAQYGTGEQQNVPVTMSDGTIRRANVYYPAVNGQPASRSGPPSQTSPPGTACA